MDIAQKPNKSGQILDQRWKILFVIFTNINSSQDFFLYCKNFGVDGNNFVSEGKVAKLREGVLMNVCCRSFLLKQTERGQ